MDVDGSQSSLSHLRAHFLAAISQTLGHKEVKQGQQLAYRQDRGQVTQRHGNPSPGLPIILILLGNHSSKFV
ncbi:hypothetical protein DPMN_011198 [Dreissena polymorpha]|uniref:Uncharacterized protein n=1 Tax=Dreissena polymorpha TaxID=45954 RepID=A0A9D4N038_DREPO|nr:hypothetical protein DPMN_011198 [Dreissena polymorpha]